MNKKIDNSDPSLEPGVEKNPNTGTAGATETTETRINTKENRQSAALEPKDRPGVASEDQPGGNGHGVDGVDEKASAGAGTDSGKEEEEGASGEMEQAAKALEAARQEAQFNYDQFLRAQAEFENYKKRIGKEHSESLKYSLTPLLREIAGIIDNLELAVDHSRDNPGESGAALLDGIEMVIKQMMEVFERFGVRRIEAAGKPFDPELHEAMTVVETSDVPENQVMEVFQTGYLLHERVVRPARVSVSKQPAEP